MPSLPRAYFVTFRTYGTWLHGDGRLSIHQRRSREYQSPAMTPSPQWRNASLSSMHQEAVVLDDAGRAIVTATVVEVCDHRGWRLLAVNARTNHVRVVLSSWCTPEQAMVTFKAWCTRRLREATLVTEEARVWSRHGSTRYLWTEAHVLGAVKYVAEGR